MKTIFVDTTYWIARFDYRDQLHAKALEIEPQLRGVRLTTSELVLIEFLNYFSKGGKQIREEASGTVQDILEDPNIQIVWQTQSLFEAGLILYKSRLDKGYSLTDCVSMVVMQQSDIQEALTHDRHFAQEGFAILL
jgi:predicted nucleic acid-binding protein